MELFFLEMGIKPVHFNTAAQSIMILTTPSLVQSTMSFLAHYHITLHHSIAMQPLRLNDEFIIEAFLSLDIGEHDLKICNSCRLYLKVCFLSELTTGDGMFITEDAWAGQYLHNPLKDQAWPQYKRPPASHWRIWQHWVSKAFLSRGRRLRHPLGTWLTWDEHWPWYISQEGDLYSLQGGKWYSHSRIIRCNRLPVFHKEAQECTTPADPFRATVYFKGERIICTGSDKITPSYSLQPVSFQDHLYASDLSWCLYSLELKNDGKDLADAIVSGSDVSIIAVSDGSFKDTFGTAAWTIGTETEEHLIAGKAICPGGPDHQSSYRSELTGLYAILAITNQMCLYFDIKEGHIEIGCDGQSALQTAFEYEPILSADLPDFDILGAIYYLRKQSRITWSFRHVKGHQDEQGIDLDLWA
jgi:hypothetical protein